MMNRKSRIAPLQTSFLLSTQFPPPPPSGGGNGESTVKRGVGCMPSPRRSSLPPLSPKIPTPRQQINQLQNFNPGPRLPPHQPPVFSFRPMMSPPSAPVAYHNSALPPRPTTSSVSAHRRAYSDNHKSMEEEGPGEKEFHGDSFMDEYVAAYMDLDKIYDFSDDVAKITSGGAKKRTLEETAPSNYLRRCSVSPVDYCNNLNGNSSPENYALGGIKKGVFSASQMNQIVRSEKLKKQAVTNPKYVKRLLTNRESSFRVREKRRQHVSKLEETRITLETEVASITAQSNLSQRTNFALEEENKQMRIRLQEMEEQAKRDDALTEYYKGEINRLEQKGTREIIPNSSEYEGSNMEMTMDENMLMELLNLEETNYGFE